MDANLCQVIQVTAVLSIAVFVPVHHLCVTSFVYFSFPLFSFYCIILLFFLSSKFFELLHAMHLCVRTGENETTVSKPL
jgi:hypothetical protein